MSKQAIWPQGKKFAFTVFDDTDGATVANTAPVYALLEKLGILTTKSVWVYPPRGRFDGGSLQEQTYLKWILDLKEAGFEIGLHNVGDGDFVRKEILDGISQFTELLGQSPRSHTNHVSNPDNLHWWGERFEWPISAMYGLYFNLLRGKKAPSHNSGSDPRGPRFWGDKSKELDLYVRNFVFNDINTLKYDPLMPWHSPTKPYVNWWFSSSDGHNCQIFNDLIHPENIDRLEAEGGACIVYTHFASGFVNAKGEVDPIFRERMEYLASKGSGWFVPVTALLDHLRLGPSRKDASWTYRMSRNLVWSKQRLEKKRRYGM
ncbi:hypothetical protein [Alkalispirochaeta sphaeroplastigenens]|uniref:hypothetical protein n=1 Tax=Alkalispirochaeta sphaeroplastigenens TaxID=1187066 RepID=UPI0011AF5480|nr:hypothetical protein [Alkalispirochaeta sphaeroplastigenens]